MLSYGLNTVSPEPVEGRPAAMHLLDESRGSTLRQAQGSPLTESIPFSAPDLIRGPSPECASRRYGRRWTPAFAGVQELEASE
ncbi:hypothetical protein MNBD_ALPHA04-495 [hydrothermal vent metagenome]|uniref:Uncharacterized protein n=1 Tax=hydrothermal vent metagenome TaxID=652676 RepID=A0A3B0S8E3_9ZZZZ